MLKNERQEKLVEYINQSQSVTVEDLLENFHVSRPTIIRDLSDLDKQGLIYRTHGGAMSLSSQLTREMPFREKELLNVDKKKIIGGLAMNLVENEDTIIIDSGSTTLEFSKLLNNNLLRVITNDIRIGIEFSNYPKIDLFIAPGKLVKSVYTIKGLITMEYFKNLSVDKLFLGVDAIDTTSGIYNVKIDEGHLKKVMMDSANSVIVLADSSKFGKKAFSKVCNIDQIDCIITDEITKEDLEYLLEQKIRVITPRIDTNKHY